MGPKRPGHHRGVSSARSRGSSIGSVIYMPHHIRSISSTYQSASQKLPVACPVAGQRQLHLMRDPPRSPDVVNSPISSRASLLETLRCIMLQTNQIFRKYSRYKSRHIPTSKERASCRALPPGKPFRHQVFWRNRSPAILPVPIGIDHLARARANAPTFLLGRPAQSCAFPHPNAAKYPRL